jgi:hypothetical protein
MDGCIDHGNPQRRDEVLPTATAALSLNTDYTVD